MQMKHALLFGVRMHTPHQGLVVHHVLIVRLSVVLRSAALIPPSILANVVEVVRLTVAWSIAPRSSVLTLSLRKELVAENVLIVD